MGFSGEVLKVLIVEDNTVFREIIEEFVQAFFPSVFIYGAAEGKEALRIVDTYHPELIFMDIRLPGENGLQLTKKIKASYPDTKVVILTSYDTVEYREAAFQSGANCFITKDSMNWREVEKCINSFNWIQ